MLRVLLVVVAVHVTAGMGWTMMGSRLGRMMALGVVDRLADTAFVIFEGRVRACPRCRVRVLATMANCAGSELAYAEIACAFAHAMAHCLARAHASAAVHHAVPGTLFAMLRHSFTLSLEFACGFVRIREIATDALRNTNFPREFRVVRDGVHQAVLSTACARHLTSPKPNSVSP